MFAGDKPFVLFEDLREKGGGRARLYANPVDIIAAHSLEEVAPALEALRAARPRGLHAAGWLTYEAGLAFEPRLANSPAGDGALIWFGLFERVEMLAREDVARLLPDRAGAWISPPRPRLSREAYEAAFARARRYISSGDIYQVNLSYRADVTILGGPLAAYAQLRDVGGGGWSGVAYDGVNWLLSTSPELFFRLAGGELEARPMKGTAKRDADGMRDRQAALALAASPKERAENLMIVDLLRNDISRIAEVGSVEVPALFSVETYPTVHTLTSTVRGKIHEEYDAIDALAALFPCGSITGAPKIRAMEIIGELEGEHRGAYTGSIGWMAPDGTAELNVAIRTLVASSAGAHLGLGSAVVYDSVAAEEWEECLLKGAFLTVNSPAFELIETMRFEPGKGIALLEGHLARLRRSALTFGFALDEAKVRVRLDAALAGVAQPCVARLTLDRAGEVAITFRALPAAGCDPIAVALAPLPVDASDFRLRHKTTLRDFYDQARAACGADEVIFVDGDGFITEGSVSNIFVAQNGKLATPPETRGLLPGVLRANLLASGAAREEDLRTEDLEAGFFIGNAVRGLVPAQLSKSGVVPPA